MKILKLLPLLSILLFGCKTDTKLTYEQRSLNGRDCSTCADILIKVPYALDDLKISRTINSVIDEEIMYALKFDETHEVTSVEGAMASFDGSYQKMLAEFGGVAEPWEAKVSGIVTFENSDLVTIALENYTYTGGAHGYFYKIFLSFDRKKGLEIEPNELFGNLDGFQQLAESKFREAYEVAADVNINATGFMFDNDTFHLPENFGFTAEGIELHYNQYEAASYADGPLVVMISFTEANPFLKESYRVKP